MLEGQGFRLKHSPRNMFAPAMCTLCVALACCVDPVLGQAPLPVPAPSPPPYSSIVIINGIDPRIAINKAIIASAARGRLDIAYDAVSLYNALRSRDADFLRSAAGQIASRKGHPINSISVTVAYTGAEPNGFFDVYILCKEADGDRYVAYAVVKRIDPLAPYAILPGEAAKILLNEIAYNIEYRGLPIAQLAEELEYDVPGNAFRVRFFVSGITEANKRILQRAYEDSGSIAQYSRLSRAALYSLGLTGTTPPPWLSGYITLSAPPFSIYPNITAALGNVLNAGNPEPTSPAP